ncbi:MAG TPA: phosphate ABC transporter permease subunit PstC [Fimbriimonadales bacterium]|nr:phosphate ABC transporter permease subunit PstC [Fimbriimonadales bacterium]
MPKEDKAVHQQDKVFQNNLTSISLRKWRERIARALTFLCAGISIFTTLAIVYVLISQSWGFFKNVSLTEFLTGTNWQPPRSFGVLPLVAGTLQIAVGAGLLAIPIGLFSAVYLSEYASARARNIIKPVLELLAGIPTIVYGFFAVSFVTPLLQKTLIPDLPIYNALSASIVVGIMILPMVASLSEEALRAVPHELREGGLALGATKGEVVRGIVIPGALSGVMSAFLLALSRAVGETMAVTLAAGAQPNLTLDPRESIETMSAYIVLVSQGEAPYGSLEYQTIFAVGLYLFAITLVINLLALRLVTKYRQKYT